MSRFMLGLCFALTACVINNGDDPPEDPPPPPPGGDILPKEGPWTYDDTPVSDTCPGGTKTEGFGGFVIGSVTSSGFTVIPDDGSDPFSCDLDGGEFDCPDRVNAVEDLRPTVDAVITVRARANGKFSSSTAGTGSQEADATCEGSQCGLGGNVFPCSAKVNFVVNAL